MTATVTWADILLRVLAALVAGGLLGYDRGARGRIAGLRTTILICLAAAGAMIEANLTLNVTGHTSSHFAVMDALRFPLGILSGIGFIGAGAIVRRGQLVTGVTTAATMWLTTVIGLILGGGYLPLGCLLTLVAFLVLSLLKRVEQRLTREHRGRLLLRLATIGPSEEAIRAMIQKAGFVITSFGITYAQDRCIDCRLEWYSSHSLDHTPPLVKELADKDGVSSAQWEPISAGHMLE